jgi:hypothetical protein
MGSIGKRTSLLLSMPSSPLHTSPLPLLLCRGRARLLARHVRTSRFRHRRQLQHTPTCRLRQSSLPRRHITQ